MHWRMLSRGKTSLVLPVHTRMHAKLFLHAESTLAQEDTDRHQHALSALSVSILISTSMCPHSYACHRQKENTHENVFCVECVLAYTLAVYTYPRSTSRSSRIQYVLAYTLAL